MRPQQRVFQQNFSRWMTGKHQRKKEKDEIQKGKKINEVNSTVEEP